MSTKKVFIVDDNKKSADMAIPTLIKAGIPADDITWISVDREALTREKCKSAYNGALEVVLAAHAADNSVIVLMDYEISVWPGLDGYQFVNDCLRAGMSVDNFIGVSGGFSAHRNIPAGMHLDETLRESEGWVFGDCDGERDRKVIVDGSMNEGTRKLLGLPEKGFNLEIPPHSLHEPPEL